MCDSPVSARKERETSQVSKGGLKKNVDFFHTRGGGQPWIHPFKRRGICLYDKLMPFLQIILADFDDIFNILFAIMSEGVKKDKIYQFLGEIKSFLYILILMLIMTSSTDWWMSYNFIEIHKRKFCNIDNILITDF